jgi:hypothetical protein
VADFSAVGAGHGSHDTDRVLSSLSALVRAPRQKIAMSLGAIFGIEGGNPAFLVFSVSDLGVLGESVVPSAQVPRREGMREKAGTVCRHEVG